MLMGTGAPTTNIGWNAFGTLAVLTNTVAGFYCCDSKAKLSQAEAEIQIKNGQILQMADTQQKLVQSQTSAMQAADATMRLAKDDLESAKREHADEKDALRSQIHALEKREKRAKAELEKARADSNSADGVVPGSDQPDTGA